MRICVIFNPSAKGEKAQRFRRHLDEIASECTLKLTTAAGDARRLAAEAVAEGFEILTAAGGDGTVNEVLNGIIDVPNGLQRAKLAVIPLGTVNVFARELRIPVTIKDAWRVIRRANSTLIDLPSVEFSLKGQRAVRHFAQLAGAGLDARAVELVHWPTKKRIGPLAYIIAGLRALTDTPLRITAAGNGHSATGGLVLIGNGRLYGGPYRVFPKADLRDGFLEVCVFPKVDWLTLAHCGPTLLFQRCLPESATRVFQAETLTLTAETPTPLEVDGELIGHLPATFKVQRSALPVVAP